MARLIRSCRMAQAVAIPLKAPTAVALAVEQLPRALRLHQVVPSRLQSLSRTPMVEMLGELVDRAGKWSEVMSQPLVRSDHQVTTCINATRYFRFASRKLGVLRSNRGEKWMDALSSP
jgi:hypothetical protein